MARVPSPRHDIDRGLWIPDLREGSFFPLRTCCQNSLPAICPSQRSPTPRLRHCGLSVTSPIRFLPCADGSSPGSSPSYRAAHVAERKQRDVHAAIYDTVVLDSPTPRSCKSRAGHARTADLATVESVMRSCIGSGSTGKPE